ncbi:hypothetical protein QVD17_03605 [Tagetes erecta]|uniref:Secreted protein n=1 Tax=Tagetes erecta TaxID=13708 RepID=A0AAD8PA39_TARER|nr:hypothetical protein QVD17_03605 [Tagetes erecta]
MLHYVIFFLNFNVLQVATELLGKNSHCVFIDNHTLLYLSMIGIKKNRNRHANWRFQHLASGSLLTSKCLNFSFHFDDLTITP